MTNRQKAIVVALIWVFLKFYRATVDLPAQASIALSLFSIALFILALYFLSRKEPAVDKGL